MLEQPLNRRNFLKSTAQTALGYSLVSLLWESRLLAADSPPDLSRWVTRLNERCADLRTNSLSSREWQQEIERLLEQVPIPELLRYLDFDALEQKLTYPDLGVDTERVRFPGFDSERDDLQFFPKLFGMSDGRAVIPHGHRYMASAHLVLGGEFHLRHYDRVVEEEEAWIVEPTIDRIAIAGDASSITDVQNNVHWLIATGGPAYTLDVILTGLGPEESPYEIQNLDPDRGEALGDGTWRWPMVSVEEGLERYGKSRS